MRLLALMQNQWLRNADRHQAHADSLRENFTPEQWWRYREKSIPFALFRGCKSGRVLGRNLGDLCDRITWEETTTRISADPSEVLPIEPLHVQAVFARYCPDAVIAFGGVAIRATFKPIACGQISAQHIVYAPHPAVRDPKQGVLLREACALFRELAGGKSL